ncbi:MAG: cytochrome P450 [Dehalococcoidia bacterium]
MEYNPLDPATKRDPYPAYAYLRQEHPVYRIEPLGGVYALSRYDDVNFALNHPELFSSTGFTETRIHEEDGPVTMLIFADPPDHTRLRNLVNRGFTPKMIADLEPRIREVTRELIDRIVAQGETDLIADLAMPLPTTIIAEILGVGPERKDDFKRWSDWIVREFLQPIPEEEKEAQQRDMTAFTEYFEAVVEDRRASPQDDLISALVRAETEQQALTPHELLVFIILLLVAGNETTTNLIGNAIVTLLEHPDQLDVLRADPSLLPNAIEEVLRYEAPVQFLLRRATQDVEIGGATIPQGSMTTLLFASANRDGRRFPDGERFDITRDAQGHVAFGHGIHFCLGAPLARLEGRIALEEVLSRLPGLARAEDDIELVDALFLRGPKRLPLTFTPAAVSPAAGARS